MNKWFASVERDPENPVTSAVEETEELQHGVCSIWNSISKEGGISSESYGWSENSTPSGRWRRVPGVWWESNNDCPLFKWKVKVTWAACTWRKTLIFATVLWIRANSSMLHIKSQVTLALTVSARICLQNWPTGSDTHTIFLPALVLQFHHVVAG